MFAAGLGRADDGLLIGRSVNVIGGRGGSTGIAIITVIAALVAVTIIMIAERISTLPALKILYWMPSHWVIFQVSDPSS